MSDSKLAALWAAVAVFVLAGCGGHSGGGQQNPDAGADGATVTGGHTGSSGRGSGGAATAGSGGDRGGSGGDSKPQNTGGTGGGSGGSGGENGSGGSDSTGGSGGTTGSGGDRGTSGSGGTTGMSGSGGDEGTSGSGGDEGTSGSGGDEGTSGNGGTTGTGGSSGAGASGSGGSGEVDAGEEPDGGTPPVALMLSVYPAELRHAISPHIYGVNDVTPAMNAGAKLVRLGGSSLSGYNWELNATNIADGNLQRNVALGSSTSTGAAVTETLAAAQGLGGMAMLTLPIGDYVAADTNGDDVTQMPPFPSTHFKQNVAVKSGIFASMPDTSDDFVYQDEFVDWTKGQATTTPVVFELDNQPGIWELEHPSFHPTKASYDDVVNAGVTFASAAKAVWPEAATSGPVSYGWNEMIDLQGASADYQAHGEFLDFYLDELSAASTTASERLLDYLDFHWYPEIYGATSSTRITEDDASPDVVAARLQAPRSLWDASYVETSFISSTLGGAPLQLVPRMQAKIAAHYAGTKLAITEWYYGGGTDISGAIASADVLGIFGREGVDLAAVEIRNPSPFTLQGFNAFLDYDGSGAHFGDTSVRATTSDIEGSSVYGSISAGAEDAVVIVALNKLDAMRDVMLTVSSTTNYASCVVYELTSAGTFVAGPVLSAAAANTFGYEMPARSIAVLVPQQ